MKLFITGGTGLIGTALIETLLHDTDHHITIYVREHSPNRSVTAHKNSTRLTYVTALPSPNLDLFDAVINLAGEPIIDKRWSSTQKERLSNSRALFTETLVQLAVAGESPPTVWLNASACGIYGDHAYRVNEETPLTDLQQTLFLQTLCLAWEASTKALSLDKTRLCLIRTGVVLSTQNGMLQKLLVPFNLGLGTILGNGSQHIPWITIDDHIRALIFALEHPSLSGPINLCAPQSASQKEFSLALAQQLHRPLWLKIPRQFFSLLLGESSTLLFIDQQVEPKMLLDHQFEFKYPTLEKAFAHLL